MDKRTEDMLRSMDMEELNKLLPSWRSMYKSGSVRDPEEMSRAGKIGGKVTKERGTGIFVDDIELQLKWRSDAGKISRDKGKGIHGEGMQSLGAQVSNSIPYNCPHCGKMGNGPAMKSHINRCPLKGKNVNLDKFYKDLFGIPTAQVAKKYKIPYTFASRLRKQLNGN